MSRTGPLMTFVERSFVYRVKLALSKYPEGSARYYWSHLFQTGSSKRAYTEISEMLAQVDLKNKTPKDLRNVIVEHKSGMDNSLKLDLDGVTANYDSEIRLLMSVAMYHRSCELGKRIDNLVERINNHKNEIKKQCNRIMEIPYGSDVSTEKRRLEKLCTEFLKLRDENEKLRDEHEKLRDEHEKLRDENEKLRDELEQHKCSRGINLSKPDDAITDTGLTTTDFR